LQTAFRPVPSGRGQVIMTRSSADGRRILHRGRIQVLLAAAVAWPADLKEVRRPSSRVRIVRRRWPNRLFPIAHGSGICGSEPSIQDPSGDLIHIVGRVIMNQRPSIRCNSGAYVVAVAANDLARSNTHPDPPRCRPSFAATDENPTVIPLSE
jgi:hypothetical protein